MLSGDEKISESEEPTPLQKSLLPPRPSCLGCRTYFIQHEKLQLENIFVEFKNYNQIPLIQFKHQCIILKTITAFLNTKGGAIYLGVEDQKCEILGNVITKAKQKEFEQFIAQLCKEIYPVVGSNDVKTFFIPVLKRTGVFTGRYITKIFVNQGKVDTFYTFAEKVHLVSQKANEGEKFEQRMGFIRLGPGGLQKLQGLKMYEEVYNKSKQPHEPNPLHEGCNPQPMQVVSNIKLIGFKVPKDRQSQFSNLLVKLMHSLGKIDYSQHYDQTRNIMIVQFQSSVIVQVVRDSIQSQQVNITNENDRVKYKGIESNMFVFSLVSDEPAQNKERRQWKQDKPEEKKVRQQKPKQESKKHSNKEEPFLTKQSMNKEKNKKDCCGYYVFTHINIHIKNQFLQFLSAKLPKKSKFTQFINTIMVKISSPDELEQIKNSVFRIQKQIHQYGHGERVKHGKATGHIHIYNYFEKDKEKFKDAVYAKLGKSIKKLTFKPDSNDSKRTYMDISFEDKDCPEALDILLQSEELRAFKIFNKDAKGSNSAPKMKFMLQCD